MIRESQWKLLDNYRRKLFLKNEIKFVFLRTTLLNAKLPLTHKYLALYKRTKLTRFSSKTLIQNRCVVTGRVWSVKKFSYYSRFLFRTEANQGNIPGFRRASW